MRSPRAIAGDIFERLLSPGIPSRQMLPFLIWICRIRGGRPYTYLRNLYSFCGNSGVAVDVGANMGMYTYLLSKRFRRVYAFEINDEITGWITKLRRPNIELIHCGLSSAAGAVKLLVPVVSGVVLAGWASLHPEILPKSERVVEKECRVARLDDFGITGVGFMKIDVEGHELQVLQGAEKTIAQSRPIVMIEVNERNGEDADAWFEALNYQQFRIDENSRLFAVVGASPHRGDCIYAPRERLSEMGIRA